MAIELQRGIVKDISSSEKDNKTECLVGDCRVALHQDLISNVKADEEIAVAGEKHEEGLDALAINNLTQNRISYVDGSNYVLAMGFAGFICIIGFVYFMKSLAGVDTTIGAAAGVASLVGLSGIFMMITKVRAIKRATALVKYLD